MNNMTDLVWVGNGYNNGLFTAHRKEKGLFCWTILERDKTFRNIVCKLKKKFVLKRMSFNDFTKILGTKDIMYGAGYYIIVREKNDHKR